jgi:hypothetical protein
VEFFTSTKLPMCTSRPSTRAGAQAGKGADQRALAHGGTELLAVDVGVGVDDGARRNARVGNAAVRADLHALAQLHGGR